LLRLKAASPRAHLLSLNERLLRRIRFEIATKAPQIFLLFESYVSRSLTHRSLRRRVREAKQRGSRTSVIFIHIPKTAGSSVRTSLRREMTGTHLEVYGLEDLVRWFRSNDTLPFAITLVHLPFKFLRHLGFPTDREPEFSPYIFTTVRDPIARFQSALVDARKKRLLPQKFSAREAIEILNRCPLQPNEHVRRLVTTFFAPQSKYVEGVDSSLLAVFRVEELDHSSRIWPGQTLPLPRRNVGSQSKDHGEPLSPDQLSQSERAQLLFLYANDRRLVGFGA
jgi:hypothetical protein